MANAKSSPLDGYQKPFAKRLRTLIEEQSTSQAELAKAVGVTRQAISSYTLGGTIPDIEKFEKIADYFGVSFDYLLGRSENKKNENTNIGKVTGLSDDAIAQLSQRKESPAYTGVLNTFIMEKTLFSYLRNYLLSFLFSEVQKTDYKLIPLKLYPSDHYSKIMFAQLIEHLPVLKSDMESRIRKDKGLKDRLILEYLERNADFNACGHFVNEEIDCDFEPDGYESDDDEQYQEFVEQQKVQEAEEDAGRRPEVILDFLSRIDTKGRGE